jgi:hypothetical protein
MPTLELRLLGNEAINNHKLLHFLLLAASLHLHPRAITFSTLKQKKKKSKAIP